MHVIWAQNFFSLLFDLNRARHPDGIFKTAKDAYLKREIRGFMQKTQFTSITTQSERPIESLNAGLRRLDGGLYLGIQRKRRINS